MDMDYYDWLIHDHFRDRKRKKNRGDEDPSIPSNNKK
jgi:hypothetical protein